MSGKGHGTSARKRVEALGTIRSMDVSVPAKRGDLEVTPRLPRASRLVEHVVEKTGCWFWEAQAKP